jgi:hypothetical protein
MSYKTEQAVPYRVQIINDKSGTPIFAVLPWAEYQSLCELFPDQRGDQTIIRAISELPAEVRKQFSQGASTLRVLRDWRALSQSALARSSNVNSQYISTLERSRRKLGKVFAKKLAPALGVSVAILIGED